MEERRSLTIRIPSNGMDAHIAFVDNKGVSEAKTVSLEDVISGLASSHKFSTGLLPRGTRFYTGSKGDYTIGIEIGPRVRPFGLSRVGSSNKREIEKLKVPFPGCVFVFAVRASKIRNTWVYALRNPLERMTDPMFYFPFGNANRSGHVCWGEALPPKIKEPMALIGVVNMFLDSGFNGDYTDYKPFSPPKKLKKGEVAVEDFWSLVRYVSKMDKYPSDMLKRCGTKTLQAIIRLEPGDVEEE